MINHLVHLLGSTPSVQYHQPTARSTTTGSKASTRITSTMSILLLPPALTKLSLRVMPPGTLRTTAGSTTLETLRTIVRLLPPGELLIALFFTIELMYMSTRNNRGERFYNFLTAFPPDVGDTVDYNAGIGHNAPQMMAADPGLYRLLYVHHLRSPVPVPNSFVLCSFDNFNGDGSRHADFGARQVPGDDPHPVST